MAPRRVVAWDLRLCVLRLAERALGEAGCRLGWSPEGRFIRRLSGFREYDINRVREECDSLASGRGALAGIAELMAGKAWEACRRGPVEYARFWFEATRAVPSDVLGVMLDVGRRRGWLWWGPEGVARRWNVSLGDGVDHHVHYGALAGGLESWLARLNLWALSVGGVAPPGGWLASRDEYLSLLAAASVDRLIFESKRILGRRLLSYVRLPKGIPGCLAALVRGDVVCPGDITRRGSCLSWLRKIASGLGWGPRGLQASQVDPRVVEEEIVREALRAGHGVKRLGAVATAYLALRIILHADMVTLYGYEGLEVFVRVFKASRPRGKAFVDLWREALRHSVRGKVQVKVSVEADALRVLQSLSGRVGGAGDVEVFLSIVKRPKARCWGARCRRAWIAAERSLSRSYRYIRRKYRGLIRGVDVAGLEWAVPNWVYTGLLREWRLKISGAVGEYVIVSFHAGEDYFTVMDGLRRIYEAMAGVDMRAGDRIGHGIALALDPLAPYSTKPLGDLLADMAFELSLYSRGLADPPNPRIESKIEDELRRVATRVLRRVGLSVVPHDVVEAYEALVEAGAWQGAASQHQNKLLDSLRRNRLLEASLLEPAPTVDRVGWLEERAEAVRDYLLEEIGRRGVYVEVCPTSNALVAGVDPARHPVVGLLEERGLGDRVLVGTDDPSVVDTRIEWENFYVNAYRRGLAG